MSSLGGLLANVFQNNGNCNGILNDIIMSLRYYFRRGSRLCWCVCLDMENEDVYCIGFFVASGSWLLLGNNVKVNWCLHIYVGIREIYLKRAGKCINT